MMDIGVPLTEEFLGPRPQFCGEFGIDREDERVLRDQCDFTMWMRLFYGELRSEMQKLRWR